MDSINFLYITLALSSANDWYICCDLCSLFLSQRMPLWVASVASISSVAVVISFFFCYSPFHAQRVLAVNMVRNSFQTPLIINVYTILTHISGVTYYLTATINPILYQLMSRKFRIAFKDTFGRCLPCVSHEQIPDLTYSTMGGNQGNSFKLFRSGSAYSNGSVRHSNTSFHSTSSIRRNTSVKESDQSRPRYSSSCTNLLELPNKAYASPSMLTVTSLCASPTSHNNSSHKSGNFLTVPVSHVWLHITRRVMYKSNLTFEPIFLLFLFI